MTGVAFSEEPSKLVGSGTCDVSYCREPRVTGDLFCERHAEPQKWSHTEDVEPERVEVTGGVFFHPDGKVRNNAAPVEEGFVMLSFGKVKTVPPGTSFA
jgi:hypothetical protein